MKAILSLAGWNWRMFRKLYFTVWGLLGITELVLLLAAAGTAKAQGFNFDALFVASYAWGAFAVAFVAVLVLTLRPVLQANGKAKGGYALLTLPLPRWQILAGYVVANAAAVLGLLAWQVVLCAIFYWPTLQFSGMAGVWPGGFYRAWLRNPLLRLILPSSLYGLGVLALSVVGPAILVPCAFIHSGWRRVAAFCVGLLGAGCCAVNLLLALSNQPALSMDSPGLPGVVLRWAWLALLVLLAASWAWAVRALHRAELV